MKVILPMLAGLLLLSAAAAETGNAVATEGGHFVVSYRPELEPLAINRMHRWIVHVERPDGTPVEDAELTLAGGMPDHNHGMPTVPQVTRYIGGGDYQVEGMKFHMNGRWLVTVTVAVGDVSDTATLELRL